MKRVMLIALMAIFSTVMFAQTKTEATPTTHKKKSHKTEMKAAPKEATPAAKQTEAKPAAKQAEPKPAVTNPPKK